MDQQQLAQGLTTYVVLLLSLSFHESAHAWAALKMGDDTAEKLGRISMNPLAHIDPIGTFLIPVYQIFGGGIPLMGWAKPTPYEPSRFARGISLRRGHISVAAAGPISNLILAVVFAFGYFIFKRVDIPASLVPPVRHFLGTGIVMNIGLAIFNLLPIPPLDGSHVASWGLPRALGEKYDSVMGSIGYLILWGLVLTGLSSTILGPPRRFLTDLIFSVVS